MARSNSPFFSSSRRRRQGIGTLVGVSEHFAQGVTGVGHTYKYLSKLNFNYEQLTLLFHRLHLPRHLRRSFCSELAATATATAVAATAAATSAACCNLFAAPFPLTPSTTVCYKSLLRNPWVQEQRDISHPPGLSTFAPGQIIHTRLGWVYKESSH